MTLLALVGSTLAADLCGQDTVGSVERSMEDVLAQYQTIDEAAFDRAAKQLDAAVSCLDVAPPGATVARLHQVMALVAFMNGQKGATRRALTAARLSDPAWKLSPDDFPEGHPYRQMYDTATDPGPVEPIGDIAPEVWVVDGIERAEAPDRRSFLLQVQVADAIVYSEYLYDVEDIPDRGQGVTASPWETPFQVAASAHGDLRFLAADQAARGEGLKRRDAAGLGGGGGLELRFTPVSYIGAELSVASVGGADPLLGGTFGLDSHLVGLFGTSAQVASGQPYVGARVGYARDTLIVWPNGLDGPDQTVLPVDAFLGGLEGGFRNDRIDLRLVLDTLLAGGAGLYEARAEGVAAVALLGPLAAEVGLGARSGSLEIFGVEEVVGRRRDVELRATVGATLWLEAL